MAKKISKNSNPPVMTDRMNTDNKEFKEFQALLLNKSRARSEERKIEIELLAQKFEIEDYIKSKKERMISIGHFLESYIKSLALRQYKVAEYLDLDPTIFNKVIKGKSDLNHDIALRLGTLFKIDPMLLLDVQDKNKLLNAEKKTKLSKYSIEDFIKS